MAAQESFEDKTEPASGKKKEDARKQGKVFRSQELNSAIALVIGMLILYFTGGAMASQMASMAREFFSGAGSYRISAANAQELATRGVVQFAFILAPVVLGVTIVSIALNFAQVGFLITGKPLVPDFSRLNPANGIKKIVISRRSLVELLKNILKVVVVGAVAYDALQGILAESVSMMDGDITAILSFMARGALAVGLRTGIAFLVLSVLDYLYQRFEYERDLRMTKQEVKDEGKELEGDPQVKSRVRSIQRRIAYRRMMADVPTADVVVTNPTHVAVALRYSTEKMSAPKLVAKGAELIAERIKAVAREHGVPIVEDKPLARALFQSVEVGEEIPEKLFQAVAQLLAYIYRLKSDSHRWGVN